MKGLTLVHNANEIACGKRISLFARFADRLEYLGKIRKDGSMSESLLRRIDRAAIKNIDQQAAGSFNAACVFNPNGKLYVLSIQSGQWVFRGRNKITRLRVNARTLEADVQYLFLRVCMFYEIDESSVFALVIKHAINSTYRTYANK